MEGEGGREGALCDGVPIRPVDPGAPEIKWNVLIRLELYMKNHDDTIYSNHGVIGEHATPQSHPCLKDEDLLMTELAKSLSTPQT